jgi:uncharacterized lipoprotein YddW (UPF0748 family)
MQSSSFLRPIFWLFALSLSLSHPLFAQNHPKHEFRGVWVASVVNIDWPSQKNLSVEQQKAEFRRLAQSHRSRGLNALVVQIRPAADAFYASPYEPWSEWLTGTQGKAPSPYYDPLEFIIAETHALGMEFHAWINPYRAVQNTGVQKIAASHISVKKPDWIVPYGIKKVLNPGIPEVRAYIVKVVMDIVRRYDVDGIHFDDYFYPYPEPNRRFNDDAAFKKYGSGFANRDEWRRDNINQFIKTLSDSINATKPWVSFGISPFGVWRNKSKDPLGSDTRAGIATYDDLYADVLLWMKEGWIDYVAPQLYWDTEFSIASYNTLLPWWAQHSYGRHLYIGQATYRVDSNNGGWKNMDQLLIQKRMNRELPQVRGSIFYSSKSMMNNVKGVPERLSKTYYPGVALVPPLTWRKLDVKPVNVQNLRSTRSLSNVVLSWEKPVQSVKNRTRFYAIYRFTDRDVITHQSGRHLIALVPSTATQFTDTIVLKENTSYLVTSVGLDRQESDGVSIFIGP